MANLNELRPIQSLSPFKRFCCTIGNLPSSYVESMSYMELIYWLCDYLQNTVIPAVNNNANAVLELQNLYVQLKNYVDNYFNNLDVQEEINNKLDEMVQTGELNNIIENYLGIIQPNKNFDLKLGTSTWFHNKEDGGANALNKDLEFFDSIIQCHNLQYNNNTGEIESKDANINLQITNINNYLQNGGKIAGVKFHLTNLLGLFQDYGSSTICNAYKTYVMDFLNNLPYKNLITKVWVFNEGNSGGNEAFTSLYENDIISVINRVKSSGFNVSIPFGGGYAITKCSQNIINSLDFISANTYPQARGDYDVKNSSLDEVINRFNFDFEMFEKYIQNKDLYVTEIGCSSSWVSFKTPSYYQEDKNGKPISLFLEGFFKSKFISNCKGVWIWYFDDAISYAPYTLLSIKNNTEVRYAK